MAAAVVQPLLVASSTSCLLPQCHLLSLSLFLFSAFLDCSNVVPKGFNATVFVLQVPLLPPDLAHCIGRPPPPTLPGSFLPSRAALPVVVDPCILHAVFWVTSQRRKVNHQRTSVSIRCEQGTKDSSGLDVWLGRLAMVGFATAITVEISTGKGLLEVWIQD
ncbi:hypothetical protein GW17_00028101 [Ensete ventricosum]|nr:hypothetical protein GW17_00028101 [Ensete ventricosum]